VGNAPQRGTNFSGDMALRGNGEDRLIRAIRALGTQSAPSRHPVPVGTQSGTQSQSAPSPAPSPHPVPAARPRAQGMEQRRRRSLRAFWALVGVAPQDRRGSQGLAPCPRSLGRGRLYDLVNQAERTSSPDLRGKVLPNHVAGPIATLAHDLRRGLLEAGSSK
jgi:hypothetical protein